MEGRGQRTGGASMGDPAWCPVLRPNRAEFSRPFVQYVEEAFKANPDAPMLKVVPPKGWTPRTEPFPSLDSLRISTPIKQHVSGLPVVPRGLLTCRCHMRPQPHCGVLSLTGHCRLHQYRCGLLMLHLSCRCLAPRAHTGAYWRSSG